MQTTVPGVAQTTDDGGIICIRFVRAGRPRARRGRARLAFCRSKSQPSAPEHCGREFSGRRNSAVTAERRPLECKKTPVRYIFVTGAAKGVRGKAFGLSPEWREAPRGAGRGADRAAKPRIKKPFSWVSCVSWFQKTANVTSRRGRRRRASARRRSRGIRPTPPQAFLHRSSA